MLRNIIIAAFTVGMAASPAWAKPFEMDVLETEDLRLLYFDPFQTYLKPHLTRSFHNSIDFQKRIFDWQPYQETTVILQDFTDYGGGGAVVSPYNTIFIDIAPKNRTLETIPGNERFFMLMNHELVHTATLETANQQDLGWRKVFGGKVLQSNEHPESILYNYLTSPRLGIPRWYGEGIAVFMETWMAGGIGRAQGGYDEMAFRAMVRDGAHFYSNLGLVSEGTEVDFLVGANAYLYGTRFISYLAYAYSPEKVVEWMKRGEGSERYYSKQFEAVFGKDLESAWDDWIAFEHEFQEANLARVREHPLTQVERLTDEAVGWASRSFYDARTDSLIGGFRYPGVVAHIGRISLADGSTRRLNDIKGPMLYRVTTPAFDPAGRTLFYTADNLAWRDLMAVDVDTGESRMLIRDARVGDLVFSPVDRSIWGLRHLNGVVTLVQIPAPYEEWTQVYSWPQGQVAFELDVAPDGQSISVSVGEIDGDQYLRVFRIADLEAGRAEPVAEYNFSPAVPEGFVFSPDGRYLYGSSYITGASNIIRYEIATGDITAVSNAETGLFHPIPMEDGSLLVYEYTGQGFVPARINPEPLDEVSTISFLGNEIARKHPIVREWSVVNSLRETSYEALIRHEGKYRPNQNLRYAFGYPVVQGYRDEFALGWHFSWQDPTQLNRVQVDTAYSWDTPSDESLHLNVEWNSLFWYARAWHNYADFYDLFGPTERARKGSAFMTGYKRALIYDEPKRLDFSAEVAYYTDLDTLPNNQNRPTFFIEDILTAKAGLQFSHTRKSLGAVDHEKGWRWNLDAVVDHSRADTIPKLRGGLDFGFALPWKHASIWLYSDAGWADGDRQDPLTNYYFGGFHNNYVDDKEVKRYREYYSMPGFEIDEIGGREFAKVTAEFNFPPIRFSEVGTPSLFLKHIRPAVFAMGLLTDPGETFERTTASAGVQLDLEFTLMHRLSMTLSVGWAAGFEDGDKHDDEWLISLKIL